MLTVALTGGLGSGKTFTGKTFEKLGCFLIQADVLGHLALLPDGEAYSAVIAEFGRGILDEEGMIQRKKLAAEVFADPARLAVLNSLIHPPVRSRTLRLLSEFAAREPKGIAVVEAAIHIETGGYKEFDRLVLAWCRREQQIERAMHRDGASQEDVLARLARQMPLDDKRRFAHYIIDTSGTKEDTVRQTEMVFKELRSIAQ